MQGSQMGLIKATDAYQSLKQAHAGDRDALRATAPHSTSLRPSERKLT
jgi:hypothetical protein